MKKCLPVKINSNKLQHERDLWLREVGKKPERTSPGRLYGHQGPEESIKSTVVTELMKKYQQVGK